MKCDMGYIKRLFAFLLGLGIFSGAAARPAFEKLSIEDGLSQSDITAVVQDAAGFIWFATNNGLNRYDGYEFVSYKREYDDPESISSNTIFALEASEDGSLWIGGKNGIDRYDIEYDRFRHFPRAYTADGDSLRIQRVNALHITSGGEVWIGVREHLCRFDRAAECFVCIPLKDASGEAVSIRINSIASNGRGDLLLGTHRGLYSADPRTGALRRLFVPSRGGRTDVPPGVSQVRFDAEENVLYAGCEEGLFVLDDQGRLLYEVTCQGEPIRQVSALLKDSEKMKWVGTRAQGLYRIYQNRVERFRHDPFDPSSLSCDDVLSLFEDRSHVLWVGTSTGGVNKWSLHRRPFRNFGSDRRDPHSLSDNVIRGMYVDDEGIVWAGTKDGCLNRLDPVSGRAEHYAVAPGVKVTTVIPRDERRLWIGTGSGLYIFDKRRRRFDLQKISGLNPRVFVGALFTDSRGRLWLGSYTGIHVVEDGRVVETLSVKNGLLSDNNIRVVYEDSHGRIWIGTRDRGMNCTTLDPRSDSTRVFRRKEGRSASLSHDDVSALFEDSRGRLWVGTWGGGLNLLEDPQQGRFKVYTERNGLSDNVIFSIAEDLSGQLWISTYNGLSCFDPQTETFRNFTFYDGLPSNEFSVKAHYRTADGTIYLGGIGGITIFDPEEVKKPCAPPAEVAITSLSIFNSAITPKHLYGKRRILERALFATDHLTLSYEDRSFTLGFVSFSYAAPSRNRFAYMMEGLDQGWNYVDGKHSITYSNLRPGRYVFKVKGSNADCVWNERPAELHIRIRPPLWFSTGALAAYALLTLVLLGTAIYHIVRGQKRRSRRMIQRVKHKSLQEVYNEKMRFYTNISHELRTPLTLIVGLIDKIGSTLGEGSPVSEQVNTVRRNADMLLRLINELLDLRRIESGNMEVRRHRRDAVLFVRSVCSAFEEHLRSRNIALLVKSSVDSFPLSADWEKTEKILYNLLSNAMKFTRNIIEVSIGAEYDEGRQWLTLCVRDNGDGVAFEEREKIFTRFFQSRGVREGTGIGLHLALEMARIQGGDLTVSGGPGQGASFLLRLPVPEECAGTLPEEAAAGGDSAKPLLLVVDDNDDMRYFLREILSDDYRIVDAADGESGFLSATEFLPELILCDVMMPNVDGLTLLQRLKSDPATAHIPIILITADNSEDSCIKGLGLGADGYLVKPFSEEYLKSQISNVFSCRRRLSDRVRLELLSQPGEVAITSAQERLLLRIVTLVEQHVADEGYDVQRLSEDLHISRMHLHRQLKRMLNVSPGEFIRNFRLTRAADLLKQEKIDISEVAYMVGFGTPKYFRVCFRARFGMSPLEYRRQQTETSAEGDDGKEERRE